jgi:hypothetical protein
MEARPEDKIKDCDEVRQDTFAFYAIYQSDTIVKVITLTAAGQGEVPPANAEQWLKNNFQPNNPSFYIGDYNRNKNLVPGFPGVDVEDSFIEWTDAMGFYDMSIKTASFQMKPKPIDARAYSRFDLHVAVRGYCKGYNGELSGIHQRTIVFRSDGKTWSQDAITAPGGGDPPLPHEWTK